MRKYYKIIILLFIASQTLMFCSSNEVDTTDYSSSEYLKMTLDEDSIVSSYNDLTDNEINNEINIDISSEYLMDEERVLSIDEDSIIDLTKKYKYHIDKNDTKDPVKDDIDSIQNIVNVPNGTSSLDIQSNTLYLLGRGEYFINTTVAEDVENVIIIGAGVDKTVIVGAIGFFNSKDLVISNLCVYYEVSDRLSFSSIAFVNSSNVFIDYVMLINSPNGLEFSNTTAIVKNLLSVNNSNTGLYAYDKSAIVIMDSIIAKSDYNGIYCEDSKLEVIRTTVDKNGHSGAYIRNSNVEFNSITFRENSKYGIQLKASIAKVHNTNFNKAEQTFDYEADFYFNYSSKYSMDAKTKKNITIKSPKVIKITKQEELDEALESAKTENNLVIAVADGNYSVGEVIPGTEDIYITGTTNNRTRFTGYLAFAACYDIMLKNLDLKFIGGEAFNVVEFKNSYFVDIENVRVSEAKQNGIQASGSIVNIKNFNAEKCNASGIALVKSKVDIEKSMFEYNKVSGISSVLSEIALNGVKCKNNTTYNGLSSVESKITITNSEFESNAMSGISSENSLIKISNSKTFKNKDSGIDIIGTEIEVDNVSMENNMEYGLKVFDLVKAYCTNVYISSNKTGGIMSDGESIVSVKDSVIRNSKEYAMFVKDNKSENCIVENTKIDRVKYGIHAENSIITTSSLDFDNIISYAFHITKLSKIFDEGSTFGDSVGGTYYCDRTSECIKK